MSTTIYVLYYTNAGNNIFIPLKDFGLFAYNIDYYYNLIFVYSLNDIYYIICLSNNTHYQGIQIFIAQSPVIL